MTEGLPGALTRVAAFLRDVGQPYALIGGLAVVARVRARATDDIDLLVALSKDGESHLLACAEHHGYTVKPEDRAMLSEGLVRLSHDGGVFVDVLVADSPYLREVIARADDVDLGPARLACASVEDIVLLKLEAHRGVDVDDILAIKDALGATLDMNYLRTTASRLGLMEKLEIYLEPV